jgi:UDP-4-amino-4,6-dideoxy-N-acetyl-beta-L-altrosamine transaminase
MRTIPYSRQGITDEDIDAVVAALRSDFLTQGPAVPAFEAEFASRHGAAHAVAVSNATAALHLACLALGVREGSRVWTSPNSFVASANCALYCGAKLDFVDIDPHTRNMSSVALMGKLEDAQKEGGLPDVVIPVDFAGLPCELKQMRELADQYGFKLLEDASHATGATYRENPVGSLHSHATVFSFHAVKIITTAEGGVVTTQDAIVADRLRLLRSHGITRDASLMRGPSHGPWYYQQLALGYNYRMTDMQAALGSSQLRRMDEMRERREAIAAGYDARLTNLPLILPARSPESLSAWHLYVVEIDETRTTVARRAVFDSMRAAGVGVNVHYIPIHMQPYFQDLGFNKGSFPASERYYDRALSLPMFPAMTEADQDYVVAALATALDPAC